MKYFIFRALATDKMISAHGKGKINKNLYLKFIINSV